jgi:hypothetical protein
LLNYAITITALTEVARRIFYLHVKASAAISVQLVEAS